MTSGPDSVDPELVALREELALGATALAERRVLSRLERSIPALAGAGASAAVLPASSAGAPNALRASGFAGPAKLWLVAAFALGGAVGGAAVAMLHGEAETRVVYVDRPEPSRRALEPAAPATSTTEASPRTGAPPKGGAPAERNAPVRRAPRSAPSAAPAAPEPTPVKRDDGAGLSEQQALLDQARASLGKGDGRGALETLTVHRERFPESVLGEEREALTIKSLVSAGRIAEARAELGSFELRFPRSPLLPSLRAKTAEAVTETAR